MKLTNEMLKSFIKEFNTPATPTNRQPTAMYYTNQIKNLMKLGFITDKEEFAYHGEMKIYDINKGKPARYKEYLEDAPNPKRVHFDIDTFVYKHNV